MSNRPEMFTRKDFLCAWLDLKAHEQSHEDLQTYYRKVYIAFSGAFQVDLDQKPVELQRGEEDLDILHHFFLDVFKSRTSFFSPFDDIMVAPESISKFSAIISKSRVRLGQDCNNWASWCELVDSVRGNWNSWNNSSQIATAGQSKNETMRIVFFTGLIGALHLSISIRSRIHLTTSTRAEHKCLREVFSKLISKQ